METVVEKLFYLLFQETQSMWMEKWTDIEKEQLFAFYIKGIALSKIDHLGELPFDQDPQRYNKFRESFEYQYRQFFKKERSSSDDPSCHVDTNSNNDETKKQQQRK